MRLCLDKKPNKLAYILIPFLLNTEHENEFFDAESKAYFKLRRILKSLGTSDSMITDKFVLMNCNKKILMTTNDQLNEQIEKVTMDGTKLNVNEFAQHIISKIFDKDGDPESRIRNIIINENIKRFNDKSELIDTKIKCLNFLKKCGVDKIPVTKNWIKYSLGNKLFEIIKEKYYYIKDDLVTACKNINVFDYEQYKVNNILDVKLPSI